MTIASDSPSEREEIEMLLPWYVTGRLDDADRVRVESWLQRDAGLARQVELAREEMQAARAAASAIPIPRALGGEHLMAAIARGRSGATTGVSTSLWAQLASIFTLPTARAVRFAAAAAAIVILGQAVAVVTLLNRASPIYETASGRPEAARPGGTLALASFNETATAGDVSRSLQALGISIVDGPRAGGLYVLRLSTTILPEAERDRVVAQLREQRGIIAFVTPSH